MGGILEALHRLQEIETQLNGLRREEAGKGRKIRNVERQILKLDEEVERLEAERVTRQSEADQFDRDVRTRESAILGHRDALLKARTNKEYAAILTSINTEKADSAKIERLGLEKLGEVERLEEQIAALAKERESLTERLAACKQVLENYLDQTREERTRLQQQRQGATGDVPASALATFVRVAEKHEGEGLVEVSRLHPKREDYACGGCNMTLTLEIVAVLRARDEIQFCNACGRILRLPSPTR